MRTLINTLLIIIFSTACSDNKTVDLTAVKMKAEFIDSIKWAPIDLKSWESTPAINDRVATEDDMKNGLAIYCINKADHVQYDMHLPKLAYLTDSITNKKELVVVVQIELTSQDTVAGYRNLTGGSGACLFYELTFLDAEAVKKVVSK